MRKLDFTFFKNIEFHLQEFKNNIVVHNDSNTFLDYNDSDFSVIDYYLSFYKLLNLSLILTRIINLF